MTPDELGVMVFTEDDGAMLTALLVASGAHDPVDYDVLFDYSDDDQ